MVARFQTIAVGTRLFTQWLELVPFYQRLVIHSGISGRD